MTRLWAISLRVRAITSRIASLMSSSSTLTGAFEARARIGDHVTGPGAVLLRRSSTCSMNFFQLRRLRA